MSERHSAWLFIDLEADDVALTIKNVTLPKRKFRSITPAEILSLIVKFPIMEIQKPSASLSIGCEPGFWGKADQNA